jgi:predicted N-acyltransferase
LAHCAGAIGQPKKANEDTVADFSTDRLCCLHADRKWGEAYLTKDFFQRLSNVGDRVLLVVAFDKTGELVAGALNLIGSKAIFGRNWGCKQGSFYKNLHFELCYYQAIEAAIEFGLERVEAGAQVCIQLMSCMTHTDLYAAYPDVMLTELSLAAITHAGEKTDVPISCI